MDPFTGVMRAASSRHRNLRAIGMCTTAKKINPLPAIRSSMDRTSIMVFSAQILAPTESLENR